MAKTRKPDPAPAPGRGDATGALWLGAALLFGVFTVLRPVVNQFIPYSLESSVAGVAAAMVALVAAVAYAMDRRRAPLPTALLALVVAWIAVFALGLARSPHLGAGVPQASDAALYMLVLVIGVIAARQEPAIAGIVVRLILAMAAVEAMYAFWHLFVELPRMRADVAAGDVALPDELKSDLGRQFLGGNDAYGTFGNPNSLAGYLLIAIFLWAGVFAGDVKALFSSPAKGAFGIALSMLLLAALHRTDSKGAWVACVAGVWFFAAQRIASARPELARTLKIVTAVGVVAVLGVLALGISGALGPQPFGLSMQVRFEYWKAALGMIRDHPFGGVGLGGFGDTYTAYKTPMGWEVHDAHNDYLQLAAQLGVGGVLLYGALWWLILSAKTPEAAPAPTFPDAPRIKALGTMALAGGGFAFFLLLVKPELRGFSTADFYKLIGGDFSGPVLAGALVAIALPLLFASVFIGVGRWGSMDRASTWHGFRAAAGAVLVHQLVDFDFSSQAVMTALLLLAGLAYGARAAVPVLIIRWKTAASLAVVPILLALMVPGGIWFPLTSGVARANAEAAGQEFVAEKDPRKRVELWKEALAFRIEAAEAAPFDAAAWRELAREIRGGVSLGMANAGDELEFLKKAAEARPLSFAIQLELGDSILFPVQIPGVRYERAVVYAAQVKSYEYYAEAARLYPLHPGMQFRLGDALMRLERTDEALRAYAEAFAVNVKVADPNVSFCSSFTDPRPGAVLGLDQQMHRRLQIASRFFKDDVGVRFRYAASCLNQLRAKDSAEARQELEEAMVALLDQPALRERAHAAFLQALSCEKTQPEKEIRAERMAAARTLQDEAAAAGTPGTPPQLFEYLFTKASPKPPAP